jgi:hypothetical protein
MKGRKKKLFQKDPCDNTDNIKLTGEFTSRKKATMRLLKGSEN